MYGKTATFPVEFEIKTLRTTLELNMDLDEAHKQRMNQLNELDEKRLAALNILLLYNINVLSGMIGS